MLALTMPVINLSCTFTEVVVYVGKTTGDRSVGLLVPLPVFYLKQMLQLSRGGAEDAIASSDITKAPFVS